MQIAEGSCAAPLRAAWAPGGPPWPEPAHRAGLCLLHPGLLAPPVLPVSCRLAPTFGQKGRGAGGAVGLPQQQRSVRWGMLGSAVCAAVRHSWEHFSTGIQPGIKELVQSAVVAMCPFPHGCVPSSSCQAPAPFAPAMCQGYPALLAIEGTTVEMLALPPGVALGHSRALVLECPGRQ